MHWDQFSKRKEPGDEDPPESTSIPVVSIR